MANAVEVRVPNIGDFADVPVIDVLVKPGDEIAVDAPLVTLESEKATMDVPSPSAGVVAAVTVKVGDRVSEGTPIVTLSSGNGAVDAAGDGARGAAAAPEPAQSTGGERAIDVAIPDIGDFRDVPVIDVLVKPGDRVEPEMPLVVLESEKASMEVPSPYAGVVRDVKLKVGDTVSQGTPVLTLLTADGGASGSVPVAAATGAAGAANGRSSHESPRDTGDAAARTAAPDEGASDAARGSAQPAASVAASDAAPAPATAPAADAAPSPGAANGVVHATPSIRRLAREFGVDLRGVKGSGPHGRVTREDVQGFVKRALSTPAPAAAPGSLPFALPPWPKVDFAAFGPIERVPLSRIKKLSGPNLHRNWVAIPHVTNNDEADVTELEAFRKTLNAEDPNAKLTLLAFAMKAVATALQRFPDLNASLDGDELVHKKYYHLGFAADTPGGLVVPVVRDVDRKGVLAIAGETRALAAKARDGKLSLAEMQGSTFTISSLGGIGGTSFSPIINAPEVAILGLSRTAMRPVWDGSAFVPRLMLPLSLSYDHRVIDGAAAARFNAFLAATLADLRRVLL